MTRSTKNGISVQKRARLDVVREVAAHELHQADEAPAPAVGETRIWAIYDGYPARATPFVAREWVCVVGGRPRPGPLLLAATLERARRHVPRGLRRRPRQKADDRRILELWVPAAEPAK